MRAPALQLLMIGLTTWIAPRAPAQFVPSPTSFLNPADAPLHPDPAFISGALDNGVRYAVRSQPAEGLISFRLVVRAGALSEADDEPGAAFLTAMILNEAATKQPVGRAVLALGEGLPEGIRAIEPHIGYDAVSFTVTLPLANEKAIDLGLRFLAQIAEGTGLTEQSIAEHRPAVLARRAAMITMRDRLRSAVFPQIAPSSRVAGRATIPTDNAACTLGAESLAWFHHRRYVPARLALIAAGDAPADRIIQTIQREFGRLARQNSQTLDPAALARPPLEKGFRAAVASDPDLTQAIAEIAVLHPPTPPVRTVGHWRSGLLDRLAVAIIQSQLEQASAEPESDVHDAGARIGPVPGPATVAVASVGGEPGDWASLMTTLVSRISAVRQHPPTPAEIKHAREILLDQLATARAQASSAPLSDLLDRADKAFLAGDVVLSPEYEGTLAHAHLSALTADEISAHLASRFDLANAAFILFLPDDAAAPTPDALLASALPAILPDPHADFARRPTAVGPLLDAQPAAGRIAAISIEPRSAVTSARLSNGVSVHHRRMNLGERRVTITVLLCDREVELGQPSAAPAAALAYGPASVSRTAPQFAQALAAAGIDLRIQALGRTMTIEADSPSGAVQQAFEAIHLLLNEPRIEPRSLERWRRAESQALGATFSNPNAAVDRELATLLLGPGTPFAPKDTHATLRAMTPEHAVNATDAALAFVRRASIDAAVVGEIDRPLALDLAERYLGSIPERPMTEAAQEVEAANPPRDPALTKFVKSATPEAVVLLGIRSVTAADPAHAALELAARIITSRLENPVANAAPQARSIGARLLTDPATGRTLLITVGTIAPDSAVPLAAAIERVLDDLSRAGPTEAELIRARVAAGEDQERSLADRAWWARALALSRLERRPIAGLALELDRLAAVTSEDVRSALRAHDPAVCCGVPRLRIIAATRDP